MRLLLIEDEKKVAEFVARGLQAEHYEVDVASDGLTGWQMASKMAYDLILLDLMLPGLSGTELLKQFRSQGSTTPVLVLTAKDSTEEKVANFEAGADDYLTKPFALAELLVRVKALLRRSSARSHEALRIGDLSIDRLTHRVERAGKHIELTGKEYSLLEYLALNAGRILSRTMIVEHVWDESFESLTNIVDVYVRYLRQKIDEPFEQKLIRTVRGVGYAITDGAQNESADRPRTINLQSEQPV